MLITRTPLRVSFLGGGSDFPEFYDRYGGAVLSCSISQYIYITCHQLVESNEIMLKYSKLELAKSPADVRHPVLREILSKYNLSGVDISVSSDIPAGTGLGSSSAFTVGALHTIRGYKKICSDNFALAMEACEIEIDRLKEPIGIQDQFATALGGLNFLEFSSNRNVKVRGIEITEELRDFFFQNFLLVRAPGYRLASSILAEQRHTLTEKSKILSTKELMRLATEIASDFKPDSRRIAEAINESWKIKKTLSQKISNPSVDDLHKHLMSLGVYGAKLLGAGGSGYMLIVASPDTINGVENDNLFSTLRLDLDSFGTQVVYESSK